MVYSQIHDLLIDVRDSTDTPFSPPRPGVHGVFSSTTELTFNLKKTALPPAVGRSIFFPLNVSMVVEYDLYLWKYSRFFFQKISNIS